jgi:hypothetical protein
MADAFEYFNPGVRHPGGERLGEIPVLRRWLGPGGDGSEKNEDQNRGPGDLRQGLISPPAKVIEWSKFGRES